MITTDNNSAEDPVVKAKILQVQELTGRSENDALFALHDVNYDLNRAVEKLLESSESQTEWQEISKKKKSQPVAKVEPVVSNTPKTDLKREKSKDRDIEKTEKSEPRSRRDRGPPRFQRGRGRERGNTDDGDRNRMDNASGERSFDRSDRGGRGRGRGGAGRGRGRGRGGNVRGTRFDQNKERGPHIDTWTNDQAEKEKEKENIGSWGDMAEDEWQGNLEESKVFTPSVANDSSVFSASMNDNDAKMFTPPPAVETQVFTATSMSNSSVSPTINNTNSFQHSSPLQQQHALPQGPIGHNSMGQSPLGQSSMGPTSLGQRLDLGTLFPKSNQSTSSMNQPSQFLSQYAKEATESIKNAVGIGSSSAGQQAPMGMAPSSDATRNLPAPGQPTNQQRSKAQRTKLPPPSKIPASAVEMPGGMNFQLDVQFGDYPSAMTDNSSAGLGFGSPITTHGTVSGNYPSPQISAVPAKPQPNTGISSLDSLNQSSSQSPRGSSGVYSNQSNSTPPKDYSKANLGQSAAMSSPPDTIQYPNSQERKASPYSSQRGSQGSGSMSSNKPASSPMTYNQSTYSAGYQSSGYKPGHTTSSSYSHQTNGLTSGNLSHSTSLQPGQGSFSSSTGYQSSSFQSQGQNSLYQNSTNQSNSYSAQTDVPSSYSNGSGSSYQNQSGSYQSQSSSGYPSQSYSSRDSHSRDSRDTSHGSHGGQSSSRGYQSSSVSQSGSSYQTSVTPSHTSSTSSVYQRDSQSGGSGYNHQTYGSPSQNAHQNALNSSKLSDSIGKMSIKDTSLDSQPSQFDHSVSGLSSASLTTTTSTTSSSLASGSVNISASLGLTSTIGNSVTATTSSKTSLPVTTKAPPNLPPGVPLIHNFMPIGQPGMTPYAFASLAGQQPLYSYEDLQVFQQRIALPGHSYDMPLQPATTLSGRDQNQAMASAPYSTAGTDSKLNRMEAQSPVNAQSTQQQTPSHQQQTYISPTALPPGYNFYYPSAGVLPSGYSYPPTMYPVPSVTNAAHGGTASVQFQKPGGYGSHTYGTTGQNQDFSKGYSGASGTQNKLASGTIAVSSSASDLTGTGSGNYGKSHTQSFDKAGFHGGTPPPFNIPLPSGTQAGQMGAPAAYGTQYVPVMTHQPHSQMLHHPMQQDSSGSSVRTSQQASNQSKSNKNFNYWGNN